MLNPAYLIAGFSLLVLSALELIPGLHGLRHLIYRIGISMC